MQKPKFIDLFCGAGGLGIGLAEAGFENVLSTDSDYDAIQTMNSHSNHPVLQSDIIDLIQNLDTGQVVLPEIDLVVGDPPCQGFCAIHLSSEAADGGPIAQIQDGDMLRLDAVNGTLETLAENWQDRHIIYPKLSENEEGMGRELFSVFRRTAGPTSQGAGVVI